MSDVTIIFSTDCQPQINLLINDQSVTAKVNWTKDLYNNYQLSFAANLIQQNQIILQVNQLDGYFKIVDIVIDEINFGLVTFLVTNQGQGTQINTSGQINITVNCPVWEYWCQMMNAFNYEDYPLGSLD